MQTEKETQLPNTLKQIKAHETHCSEIATSRTAHHFRINLPRR